MRSSSFSTGGSLPAVFAPLSALALALALTGCDMAPHYVRPAPPVPQQWPQGASYEPAQAGEPGLAWRGMIGDERLRQIIDMALANSRSLREQVAAVASARAQYRVERSYQLPTLAASASGTVTRGISNQAQNADAYSLRGGMSSFEIDLFGRLRNQTKAAFETYLSTQSGLRSARLTLVAETARAYATLATDRDLLRVAEETAASGQRSLELEQSLLKSGLARASDVEGAITVVEQAKSDVANQTALVAQDRNALELLIGAPVPEDLLPASLAGLDGAIAAVPAGISSTVLLQRPDVVEAEHRLKSANASIGEARAAFFPTITLTSTVGLASTALSQLFTNGAANWNLAPSASMPLLGGPTRGNLQYAKAQRDYYLAAYELAVQTAFRDVADALARRGTVTDQRAAQDRLVTAARRAWELSQSQHQAGIGTYADALAAQRVYYADQQTRINTVLTDIGNRFSLYEALGADPSL